MMVLFWVIQNLMDQFNPGLQQLVTLGNGYIKAFQGDVLIQISETQRKLTAEVEGVFRWFHVEVLQAMDKNVKLDEEYIEGSRRVYELEVRSQAAALERQLRRGAFRDSLLKSSLGSLLQTGDREMDREPLGRVPSRAPSPLPSRSRSSSVGESLGLGGGRSMRAIVSHHASSNPVLLPFSRGDNVTVLIPEPRNGWLYGRHDSSLRQGWFPAAYVASTEDFLPLGSRTSHRSHSMNNLLEPTSQSEYSETQGYSEILSPVLSMRRASADLRPISPLPEKNNEVKTSQKTYHEILPPAAPLRRGSADIRPISPLPARRAESHFESKVEHKNYNELPPPAPALLNSPLPERKTESNSEKPSTHGQPPEHPLFPRGSNPFATVKLRPTVTNDRSAPRVH
uniref:BAR/IMD domain containing adaptor protein 2 like 2b n=1 Tax=Cyprinus carpio TaxID=7962 RepID=A0A8C2AJ63_CYPCA